MLNVAWKVTLGAATLESGRTGGLLSIDTSSDLNVPVNSCRIVLDGRTQVTALPSDPVKVELGYDTDLTLVFTGALATAELGIEQHRIEALSSFSVLTAARLNSLYEKQTAGEIANDLLSKSGVGKGTVDDGETFASFTVSEKQSVWENLRGLSARCGFDLFADTEDKAVFRRYDNTGQPHSFQYGAHILGYQYSAQKPSVDGVEIYGESPAGQGQGEDASSWLTGKPVKGTAGESAGNVLRLADPAARTESAARSFAGNLFRAAQVKARGVLRVIGAPKVRLGDAAQVSFMPDSSGNGTFKITVVRHHVSGRRGFTTWIGWEKI